MKSEKKRVLVNKPFTKQSNVSMTLNKNPLENIVGKGKKCFSHNVFISYNRQISIFGQETMEKILNFDQS